MPWWSWLLLAWLSSVVLLGLLFAGAAMATEGGSRRAKQ